LDPSAKEAPIYFLYKTRRMHHWYAVQKYSELTQSTFEKEVGWRGLPRTASLLEPSPPPFFSQSETPDASVIN